MLGPFLGWKRFWIIQAIVVGQPAGNVDSAARNIVCSANDGLYCANGDQYLTFTHRLGHGIGLQVSERGS